jgi:hypothetical protein
MSGRDENRTGRDGGNVVNDPSIPFDDPFCCDAQQRSRATGVVKCDPTQREAPKAGPHHPALPATLVQRPTLNLISNVDHQRGARLNCIGQSSKQKLARSSQREHTGVVSITGHEDLSPHVATD